MPKEEEILREIARLNAVFASLIERLSRLENKLDQFYGTCDERSDKVKNGVSSLIARVSALEAIEQRRDSEALHDQAISTRQIVYVTLIAGGISGLSNLISILIK